MTVSLPGLICDHVNWAGQQEALLAAGYKTLIMDYGNVDSIAQMAGVVLSQAPEEFIVIGHSMSGRVALEVVRQAAERVTALILIDTDELPLAQESTRTARSCRGHNAGGAGIT